MAFQPVIDTVAIEVNYTQGGEPLQNNFYAKLPGGYTLSDLNDLAAQIGATINAFFLPLQVIEAFFARVVVRGLAVPNDLIATNIAFAGAGANTNGALPNNVTLSVKKESGLTGRSARGRIYWIGIGKDNLQTADENILNTGYVTSVVTAVDKVRIDIAAVGLWEPVLVSRFADGLARDPTITFPWNSTTNVDIIVDTQRGRMPK